MGCKVGGMPKNQITPLPNWGKQIGAPVNKGGIMKKTTWHVKKANYV